MSFFFPLIAALFLIFNFSVLSVVGLSFLAALFHLGRREKTIFNPYYLFCTTPLSLLLYAPTTFPYFHMPLNLEATLVIFVGLGFFVLGLLAKRRRIQVVQKIDKKRSFWVVFFLGFVSYCLGFGVAGVPILNPGEVDAIRAASAIPIVSQFGFFLQVAIVVAFQQRSYLRIFISSMVALLFALASVSKFAVLMTFLFIIFGVTRYAKGMAFGALLKVGALSVALFVPSIFVFTFDARHELDQSSYQWRQNISTNISAVDSFGEYIFLPYLYATSPWSNLAFTVSKDTDYEFGLRTVRPFINLVQLDSLVEYAPRAIYRHPLNTFAFPVDFYLDLGLLGVALFSFVIGFFVKATYLHASEDDDPLITSLWVIVGFATVLLFFSNHFTSVGYPLILFVLFRGYRLVARLLQQFTRSVAGK